MHYLLGLTIIIVVWLLITHRNREYFDRTWSYGYPYYWKYHYGNPGIAQTLPGWNCKEPDVRHYDFYDKRYRVRDPSARFDNVVYLI